MRLAILLPAAMLVTTLGIACATGPSVKSFEPATNPSGMQLSLRLRNDSEIVGELLEARDTALLVLARDKVALVPATALRGIRATRDRYPLRYRGGRLDAALLLRLRPVSRFPAGLSAVALGRLLTHTGQTEVIVISPQ
ncbi:MAG: hypothetical protein WKG32_05900 [Gemmatimonadaceae bacterium]